MRVIVPKTIDASTLVDSNIPEPDPSAGEVEYVPVDQGGGTIGDSFNYGPNLQGEGIVVGLCVGQLGEKYIAQIESTGIGSKSILIHKFSSSNSYIGYFKTSRTYSTGVGVSVDIELENSNTPTIFVAHIDFSSGSTTTIDYYSNFPDSYYNGAARNRTDFDTTFDDFVSISDSIISYAHSKDSSTGQYIDTILYKNSASSQLRCATVKHAAPSIGKSLVHDNVCGAISGDALGSATIEVRGGKYLIFSRNSAGNLTYIQEYNSSFSVRNKINTVERLTAETQFGTYTGSEYIIGTSNDVAYGSFTGYKVKTNFQYGEVDPGDPVPAGSVFIKTSSHRKYQAVVDTLLDPLEGLLTVPPEWVELGPTNKYAAFDGVISNAASYQNEIIYNFKPNGQYNSISGFNITGATEVNITITSAQGSVVYENTFTMRDNSQVIDWYSYYFSPIIERTQFTVTDLPAYGGSTATLTVTGESTVSIGEVVVGSQIYLGVTQYGVSLRGLDFSQKTRDEFGNFNIIRRGTSKLVEYDVKVDRGLVNYVARQLDQLSTVPCVWVGSDEFNDETTVYGYHKDYLVTIDAPSICSVTISVEGLV